MLDSLSEVGSLPQMEWGPVRVLLPKRVSSLMEVRGYGDFMKRAGAQGVRWQAVRDRPSEFVAMFRNSMLDDHLRHGTLKGAQVIYSMWSGYLADDRNKRVVEALEQAGGRLTSLHSGGHAHPEDLAPERVVPMHTLAPEAYSALGASVVILNPGDTLELAALQA